MSGAAQTRFSWAWRRSSKSRTQVPELLSTINKLYVAWDLAEFTSPSFALVANQIIFTALTYSLLQQQILRQARKALNKATKKRLLEELASARDIAHNGPTARCSLPSV